MRRLLGFVVGMMLAAGAAQAAVVCELSPATAAGYANQNKTFTTNIQTSATVGSMGIQIGWNPNVLEYVGYTASSDYVVNENDVEDGLFAAAGANPSGLNTSVSVTLKLVGSGGSFGSVSLTMTSLFDTSFNNLLPADDVDGSTAVILTSPCH